MRLEPSPSTAASLRTPHPRGSPRPVPRVCTRRLRTPPTFLSLRRASCAWQTPHAKSTQLRTMSTKERKFKAGLDKDDCRKNRADQKVQLRKASKEEGNMKRRNMTAVSAEIVVEEEASGDGPGVPELSRIVISFCDANGPHEQAEQCLDAVVRLRKLLSCPNNPPIDEVINAGTTPRLVLLLQHPMSKMQFEAAWCLTNIASGNKDQCQAVVSHNAVPSLVALVGSESVEVSPSPPLTLTLT